MEAWINEELMAFFFLLIGPKIKRENIVGVLSGMKKIAMPVIGAIGGMLASAFLYVILS